MALIVKSADQASSKWLRRTENAAEELKEGIENSQKDWAALTVAAEGNYEAGVQKAVQKKSFGRGVRKAGNQKQRDGALNKGVDRFSAGVRQAQTRYEAGVGPHLAALRAATLTPRRETGHPDNFKRVVDVANIQMKIKAART